MGLKDLAKLGRKTGSEGKVKITSSVPVHIWEEIQENAWKYNELIIMGVQAKKQNPQILQRLADLEEDGKKAMEKIRSLAIRNSELEVDLARMKDGLSTMR